MPIAKSEAIAEIRTYLELALSNQNAVEHIQGRMFWSGVVSGYEAALNILTRGDN